MSLFKILQLNLKVINIAVVLHDLHYIHSLYMHLNPIDTCQTRSNINFCIAFVIELDIVNLDCIAVSNDIAVKPYVGIRIAVHLG